MQKIMEYTEMIDKVKALAAQNRAAKTAEQKVKELTMAQIMGLA